MSCKYYQKLLHLNRPGERSTRQQKRLNKHVARCGACAAEKIKIDKASAYVAAAKETKPELADPGLITAGIMRSVRGLNDVPRKSRLDFLSLPKTRLALIGLTAVLVGAFLLQEFLVLYRISRLEDRIAVQSKTQVAAVGFPAVGYHRADPVRVSETRELLRNVAAGDRVPEDGTITIKRRTLIAWLTAYRELEQENRMLLRYLREQFPELRELTLEDGLDSEEIEILKKNKKKIFNYIDRL